jgi:uncharacterized membrane protein YhaH (DUF805 family)
LKHKFFSFNKRINRSTFWTSTIVLFAVYFILVLLDFGINAIYRGDITTINQIRVIVAYIEIGIIFYSFLAISVKRMHDLNHSGFWILWILLPFIGLLWTFIELGFLKSSTEPNKYG